jgi:hypothetical protein
MHIKNTSQKEGFVVQLAYFVFVVVFLFWNMLIIYNIEWNSYKENFVLFIIIQHLQNNANLICLT